MIGNDIVDLKVAAMDSNWRRPGFLEKLFTANEREQIFSSYNPESYVWLLWTMKEAVYKANQRKFKTQRNYRPKDLTCTIISSNEKAAIGRVECGENLFFTQSTINNRYIYTTASYIKRRKVISKILPSSKNLKSHFISQFAEVHNLCKSQIKVEKDCRSIPILTVKGQPINYSFSFTHHGQFSAYSL